MWTTCEQMAVEASGNSGRIVAPVVKQRKIRRKATTEKS